MDSPLIGIWLLATVGLVASKPDNESRKLENCELCVDY